MKTILLLFSILLFSTHPSMAQLEQAFTSYAIWNGVTTSADGRVFVCFPRIEGDSGMRIGEVLSGNRIVPYPDAQWNSWKPGDGVAQKFVRTNSLRIGSDGLLWILDTGTPAQAEEVLPGAAPKLLAIDMKTNRVVRNIPLEKLCRPKSFVDDFRFNGNTIYVTDAGVPAIILVDKESGSGRRVLQNQPSTTCDLPVTGEGRQLKDPDGNDVCIHADQLEVSPGGKWFYYQPVSGPLWRIETRYLEDPALTDAEMEKHAERFYQSPTTGGTCMDAEGNIYLTDVDHQQILRIAPDGKSKVIARDRRLLWADAMWIDGNGYLWIPCGQINRLGAFQKGKNTVNFPVIIYKMKIDAKPLRS